MNDPRIAAQIEQLQTPVDKLWWFAQLERGIEVSTLDREPQYGSKEILQRLANTYESDGCERHIGY